MINEYLLEGNRTFSRTEVLEEILKPTSWKTKEDQLGGFVRETTNVEM